MNGNMKYRQRLVAMVGVALLVAVVGSTAHNALADPKGFVFTPLVFLGTPTPEGEQFLDTFDSNRLNNRGDILFTSNVIAAEAEALFLRRQGEIVQIVHAGDPAPGAQVFGPGSLSPTTLNDKGDVGFVYLLDPFIAPDPVEGPPFGINAGVYRFSHRTHTIVPVMTPGVTRVPGGGRFKGAGFGASLNNRGDLIFAGIVPTNKGFPFDDSGLGLELFKADKTGHISRVIRLGEPAPGGGVFDWTNGPWMNDRGDVAFMGHVAGEECRPTTGFPPPGILLVCLSSVYVKKAATGNIRSIAHAGDPAPGGGVYRQAYSPVINDRGDIVFFGDLTAPPDARQVIGVFLHAAGETRRVAGTGDKMPGGGRFVTASNILGWQLHLNNAGEVVFNATLNTATLRTDTGDPIPDTGLYVWSHGSLRLVARTGTVIPGVGTIAQLVTAVLTVAPPAVFVPNSGAHNNDHGQVVFGARLKKDNCEEQRGVLLLATPQSQPRDD